MVSLRTKRTYHRGYLYWHNWWWLNVQSSQREPYASVAMRRSLVSEKDANPKLMGRGSLCGKVFSLACTCYGLRRRNLDNCITRERIRQVIFHWHNWWWWINVQSSQCEPYASIAMRRSLVSAKDANPKLMGRCSLCRKVFSLACACYGLQRCNSNQLHNKRTN